jgi:hypothetical protein
MTIVAIIGRCAYLLRAADVRNDVRWYDARLLPEIAGVMTKEQQEMFFMPVFDWMVEVGGQLTRVWTSYA